MDRNKITKLKQQLETEREKVRQLRDLIHNMSTPTHEPTATELLRECHDVLQGWFGNNRRGVGNVLGRIDAFLSRKKEADNE